MLFRERKLLWPWGPMKCFELNLERISSPEDAPWDFNTLLFPGSADAAERRSRQSVLDIVVHRGYKDLLTLDLISQVQNKKWMESARGWFCFSFALYLLLIISVTLLCQHHRHGITVGFGVSDIYGLH